MSIRTRNPATGEDLKSYGETPADEVAGAVSEFEKGFEAWRRTSFEERARVIKQAASVLLSRKDVLAELMAFEMGKPVKQGRAEIEKCAWVCEYYAANAAAFLKPEPVATDAGESYIAFEPLGLVLAVMPWNFPFWQAFRAIVPALMAGNVMALKHASNVSGCALAIEDIMREAGAAKGVFRTLILNSRRIPDLIANPVVRGVTLTGSVAAGKSVAEHAGRNLKKTVLELGGSDPYVILEDADLEAAASACAASRLINGGQSCVAAKRFIVVEKVRERFEKLFVDAMREKKFGDPFREDVDLGPMARADLRDELHDQVSESVRQGARLVLGGSVPEGPGAFYPPTVLTDVRKGIRVYEEETFGPVASILPARDEAEALHIANDTVFGLGAAVFTRDRERGKRIAEKELQAGLCFVNGFVKSDPRLPFGGIRESGYGRELGSPGIREFVNIKTVSLP